MGSLVRLLRVMLNGFIDPKSDRGTEFGWEGVVQRSDGRSGRCWGRIGCGFTNQKLSRRLVRPCVRATPRV